MPHLMVACNHPDNGEFTGRFEHAEMGQVGKSNFIELEGPSTRIEYSNKDCYHRLRIGRITVDCGGETEWVGSWVWNCYGLPVVEAIRVLAYLRKRKFDVIAGDSDLFDAWKERDLTKNDLLQAIEARQ